MVTRQQIALNQLKKEVSRLEKDKTDVEKLSQKIAYRLLPTNELRLLANDGSNSLDREQAINKFNHYTNMAKKFIKDSNQNLFETYSDQKINELAEMFKAYKKGNDLI